MPIKYFDIHGHMNFAAYDADREEVIARAQNAGVGMITVGTDLKTSVEAIKLAETNEGMWATIGMHPISPSEIFNYEDFKKLAVHPKVVAIGECGLDYFHSKPEEIAEQRRVFIEHIKLANEVGKPLMLHVRKGKVGDSVPASQGGGMARSAYLEAVSILKEQSKVKANFHFFAGDLPDLKAVLDIGCTISFTGVITFAKQYEEIIRYAPLTSIMSETDCPCVSPAPYRGKRNEPTYVIEVVKKIAEIKGMSEEEMAQHIYRNAKTMFTVVG